MNKKTIAIIAIALIILGGGYILLTRGDTNSQNSADTNQPGDQASSHQSAEPMETFISSDKRVQIQYPGNWMLTNTTTQQNGNGQFGPYVQTWTVTNETEGNNAASVDFAIMQGGQNLAIESLVDCTMKTVTCQRIGINSEQFIKSESILNTGVRTEQVATFYDSNVLRVTATIQAGTEQEQNNALVQKIFDSIQFLQ